MFLYYKWGKSYRFLKNVRYKKLNGPKTKHPIKVTNSWDYKKLDENSEDDNLVIDDNDDAKDKDDCKKNSD